LETSKISIKSLSNFTQLGTTPIAVNQGLDFTRGANPYGLRFRNSSNTSTTGSITLDEGTGEFKFFVSAGGYYPTFYASGNEAMRINVSQEVLIGTTSDAGAYKIQVNGNALATQYEASGTGADKLPSGTTAQRPTATNGQIRHNSTTSQIEGVRNGSAFESFVMGSVPATLTISGGAGTPEGVVTAVVGSMYLRTDGGAGTTLYIKETGTGNTGWTAK